LAGLILGMRSGDDGVPREVVQAMKLKMDQLQARVLGSDKKIEQAAAAAETAESERKKAEAEVGRMAVELGTIEGELEQLKKDLEKPDPKEDEHRYDTIPAEPIGASEMTDDALAELDLERVAHRKTREELEALKKLTQASDGRPHLPHPDGRRGAGFQTVSIASRDSQISGTDHDRLRQAYAQLQRDKEKAETELVRAQQELQLLKMRQ